MQSNRTTRGSRLPGMAACALLSALLCVGCGDSRQSAPAAGRKAAPTAAADTAKAALQPPTWLTAPCSLVSDQEMTALLPNPVAGAVRSRGLCEYGPVDLKLGRVDIEVFVQDVAATGCDLFFSVGGFKSADPVPGIGSAARWKGRTSVDQLGVCVNGKHALLVTVYDPDKSTDPLATARKVGELVIARLGA